MGLVDAATGTYACECGEEFSWDGGSDAVHPSCPAALSSDGDRHHETTEAERAAYAATHGTEPPAAADGAEPPDPAALQAEIDDLRAQLAAQPQRPPPAPARGGA